MLSKKLLASIVFLSTFYCGFAQPTHTFTDPEKEFKVAKDYFIRGEYALAYPLLKDLKLKYPANKSSDQPHINEDLSYYYTVSGFQPA